MTSPLRRLFAVFWWLLVLGSTGLALFGTASAWGDYQRGARVDDLVVEEAINLLLPLLPFIAMTVIRWIITTRWRFGPRW